MPWHKLKPQHQFGKTATLRKDGIALSGEFIQGENLLKHGWAELFIDSALHRVGFKFHDTQTGNTYKLSKEAKRAGCYRRRYSKPIHGLAISWTTQ